MNEPQKMAPNLWYCRWGDLWKNPLGSKRRVKIEFMLDTRWKFLTEKILLLGINRGERKGASDQFVFNLNQILSKAESKHFYL